MPLLQVLKVGSELVEAQTLRDEGLEDSANLPDPDVIAEEIAEDLRAALEQFATIRGGPEGEVPYERAPDADDAQSGPEDPVERTHPMANAETQNPYPWRDDLLQGLAFVVGGASSGLGRAVAENLVAAGGSVLLVARSADALEETARELGERAFLCAADLATPEGVDGVVEEATRRFGTIGGVLVNAGGPPGGSALGLSDEQWRGAFDLLIGCPLRLLRGLLPLVNDGGSVLFVTSSSVRQPIPMLDSSNVLRPGVAALVKCLALELGPRVRVNALAPGRFDTARVRWMDQARAEEGGVSEEEQRRTVSEGIPLGRYGDPQEFGRAATFLLSPAASYITGTSLQIDGGLVTAVP